MSIVGNWEEGIRLDPGNFGKWIAIPDSPLEGRINRDDPYPSLRIRWNPETAKKWFRERFLEMEYEIANTYWREEDVD